MIKKIIFTSFSFLDNDLKKKIINLQFLYFFNSAAEFLNVSLFYAFLNSIFYSDQNSYLGSYFKNLFNLSLNSFYGILCIVIIFFLSNLSTVFLNYKIYYISENISSALSVKFYKKIFLTKFEIFNKYHPSEIIKKINNEIPILSTGIFQPLLIFFAKLFILIFFAIFIFVTLDYKTSLFFLILIIIYISIFVFFKKRLFNYGKKVSEFLSSTNKTLYETLNNFQIIKLLSKENFFSNFLEKNLYEQAKIKSYGYLIGQFPKSLIEFLIFATFAFSFLLFDSHDNQSIIKFLPVLGTVAFIGYRVLPIAQQLYSSFTMIKNSTFILDTIKNNFKSFTPEDTIKVKKNNYDNLSKILNINLKNIKFRYNEAKSNIFENFSYNFKLNNIYLINANSGKGKTTLVNIIMGFLKPSSGNIVLNDKYYLNNQNINLYRTKISFLPQFTFLFDANLYQNVTLDFLENKNNNTQAYVESLKSSNLYKELKSYINHKNKKLGHKGVDLSGGQIQRIALARVFYNNRNILIFDEPTNNLDSKNKKIILENILKLRKDRIIIILSHDSDILKYSNKVINLK
jgi:ABC-type multidrug transport system fused ATPase/permease subunit